VQHEERELVQQARRIQPDVSLALALQGTGALAPDVERRFSASLRQAGLE